MSDPQGTASEVGVPGGECPVVAPGEGGLEAADSLWLDPRPFSVASELILGLDREEWDSVRQCALEGQQSLVAVYPRHKGSYALASQSSLLAWLAASLTETQLRATVVRQEDAQSGYNSTSDSPGESSYAHNSADEAPPGAQIIQTQGKWAFG